jgi:hypothetical protein
MQVFVKLVVKLAILASDSRQVVAADLNSTKFDHLYFIVHVCKGGYNEEQFDLFYITVSKGGRCVECSVYGDVLQVGPVLIQLGFKRYPVCLGLSPSFFFFTL